MFIRFIFYWKLNVIFVCRKQNVKMIIEYPQTCYLCLQETKCENDY